MNMDRLISMIVNIFIRKAVNFGVNKGIGLVGRRGKTPSEITPADRAQADDARELAKRARKAARITRRLGR